MRTTELRFNISFISIMSLHRNPYLMKTTVLCSERNTTWTAFCVNPKALPVPAKKQMRNTTKKRTKKILCLWVQHLLVMTIPRMPILYSCHPRSRKRLESTGFVLDKRVIRQEPMGFHDYNCLQMNAFAVVSDSGTLPEESSFFTSIGKPFPAVCIRTSTERPEALDKACFVLAGIDEKSLLQAVDTAVELNRSGEHGIPVPNYVDENVSTKVVKIIQSYTGVVNKMVWRK